MYVTATASACIQDVGCAPDAQNSQAMPVLWLATISLGFAPVVR